MAEFINFEAEAEVIDSEDGEEDDELVMFVKVLLAMIKRQELVLIFIDNLQMLKMILTRY